MASSRIISVLWLMLHLRYDPAVLMFARAVYESSPFLLLHQCIRIESFIYSTTVLFVSAIKIKCVSLPECLMRFHFLLCQHTLFYMYFCSEPRIVMYSSWSTTTSMSQMHTYHCSLCGHVVEGNECSVCAPQMLAHMASSRPLFDVWDCRRRLRLMSNDDSQYSDGCHVFVTVRLLIPAQACFSPTSTCHYCGCNTSGSSITLGRSWWLLRWWFLVASECADGLQYVRHQLQQ